MAGGFPDIDDGGEGLLWEVAEWLGFRHYQEYLDALPIERERIFERARY